MTVSRNPTGTLMLAGFCPNEDAEVLQRYLLEAPGAKIDWQDCEGLHTAVVQVLMVAAAVMVGVPKAPFLENVVAPVLRRRSAEVD